MSNLWVYFLFVKPSRAEIFTNYLVVYQNPKKKWHIRVTWPTVTREEI